MTITSVRSWFGFSCWLARNSAREDARFTTFQFHIVTVLRHALCERGWVGRLTGVCTE